jgi:hypothetical protein
MSEPTEQRLGDHLAVAVATARIFERTGIAYALGGSVASAFVGEMRTTMDVDFAVEMSRHQVGAFVDAAESEFFVQREAVEESVRLHRLFTLLHRKRGVKVDVHVVPDRPIYRAEIERARWTTILRATKDEIRVATPEDVILQKLLWFRSGGGVSEHQWRDVLGVFKVRRRALDFGYLRKWAREEDILDLLQRALRESGLAEEQ